MSDFNQKIIAEFRANGGHVETAGFGDSLVILHSIGARSGQERVNPVLAIAVDGDWLIAASKAGAPENPAWYANLKAHPEVSIETGTDTVDVVASEVLGDDYAAAWGRFVAQSPAFERYAEKASERHIPVVRLSPR